jgi:hypothetical protein
MTKNFFGHKERVLKARGVWRKAAIIFCVGMDSGRSLVSSPKPPLAAQFILVKLGIMSIADLRKLSPIEKLRIIETLWNDLAEDQESFPSPAWHEDALRKTEAELAAGRVEILDWEVAKKELRQRANWVVVHFE